MSDLLTRMNDSVQKAEQAAQATFDILTGPLDVPVNVNGIDAPTLTTRIRDYLTGAGGLDGVDGKSLEFIEIREDGHLWAKIEDQPEADLGEIVPTGVEYVQYDSVTGDLEIALTDGTVIGPHNIKGDNASDVEEAFIRDGNLWLRLENGNELDAGDITRFGGAGANGADITEDGDLVILFSDGTIENVGRVRGDRGDNGVSLVSAGIDQFGVLRFLRSDGRTATAGLVNATILDSSGNTVVDVRLGGVDNEELLVELETTTLNLGKVVGEDGVDGVDGNGIASITTNPDHEVIFTMDDGSTHNAGPLRVTRIFNAGAVSIGEASIVNGELIVEFDNNGVLETRNLGNVVGADGTILSSAEIDETTSRLIFTDSESNTIDAGVVEQVNITSVDVDINGFLEVALSDGRTITSTNSVKGADGVDSDGISGAYIDASGHLFISFEGGSLADADLGNVIVPVETNATLVDGKELTFTMSDGQTFGPFDVRGDDGIYLVEARVDEGRVYVTYSNDLTVEVDIGKVEKDPSNVIINSDGTLTIEFDDNTSLSTTERVQAFDGDTITSIVFDETTNALTIEYTENNRETSTSLEIDAVRGYGIADIEFDPIVQEINIITNVPGQENISFNVPKGIDGASLQNIYRDGNDLVIEYNERGDYTTTQEFRAEGVYKEGSIENIRVDENNNLVIDVDVLTSPLVFPMLEGEDGNTISSVSFDEQNLIISTSKEGDSVVPLVRGEDGVTITDIGVNETNDALEIGVSNLPNPLSFPQMKGEDAQEAIVDIRLGGVDNRDLIIEKTSETLTVPLLRGEDGITITDTSIVGTVLTIEVSDGTNQTFDLDTIRGIDGKSINSITLGGTSGRDLITTTNLDAPEDTITIPEVKGEDGRGIDSVALVNGDQDIEITYTDSTTDTLSGIGIHITDADIDNDGKLVLTLSDGTFITSDNVIKGRDGVGTGVSDVDFLNGQLTVTIEGPTGVTTDIDAGNVSMVGVSGARIVEDTLLNEGVLWIDLNDGSSIEVGNVFGENGRFVTSVDLVPQTADPSREDLVLTFNDGSTVNAGNATGNPGRSIVNAEVAFGGDMIIEYSDGNFDNIGNIGTGAGLSVWDIDRRPYAEDQVVIHDGGLYMSLEPNNNDEPPSAKWIALALGDQVVDIRQPILISPISGSSGMSTRPRLVATQYAPIVSVDERDYRELEIDILTGDFSSPVYSVQVNSDVHEVTGFDLNIGDSYKWRVRDVSVRGDMSEWSMEQNFTVPSETVDTPSVSIHPDENAMDAFIAPEWNTSAFNMQVGTETHEETDWQIRDGSGTVIWESLNDSVNLLSIIIPNDVLVKGQSYEIRAKHRAQTVDSGWSDWVSFTVSMMDYAITPSVTGDSDTFIASPFTKTVDFEAYPSIGLDLNSAIWTVVTVSDGSIYAQDVKTSDFRNYDLDNSTIESNVDYQVTVEYVSDRFGSIVSDPFVFQFVREVSTPTVSTLEDINSFPSGGVFTSSAFNGTNETHVSSDWEVRDLNSDELLWSSMGDTENLESIVFNFGGDTSLRDLTIRVRHNGEFISSDWSNELSFFTGEAGTGPGPKTLLAGDMTDGFFGEVPVEELFTGDELAAAIGLTAGTSQHSSEPWLKFAIDEKIVFIAKKPYRHTVSWNNINAVNAVYGDANAPIVEVGGFQFRVTLMTGSDTNPESGAGGEWNRLIYKIHQDDPTNTNWASYTDADIIVGSRNGRASWTQETSSSDASSRVYRGHYSLSHFNTRPSDDSYSDFGWRPALRLIV